MTLSGSVSVGSFNLNGYDVTISALAPVIAGGLGNGTLICEGNLTINSTLTVNKGALICNGNLTIGSGNLSLGDGKADIHGNLTFGETGSLGMSSMGMTIVRGDIVSNRISNLNISAGHLYLNGDLTLTQPYRFSVPNLHISGGTNITYPSGGSVRFSKIIDPGLSRHSVIYTDGITSRYLDCTRTNNGQCSNSGCTFEQCRNSHEFPGRLECGVRLYCNSSNCNFLSTGRTCSLCVKCKICTPCENSKIFVNAYTSLNTAIRVEIESKPPNGQLPIGTPWTLTASVIPGNVNQSVTWTSSGNSVATIDANTGLITPISRGTITITARSTINSSAVATYILTVVAPVPTSISIDGRPPNDTLNIGQTWSNLNAVIYPLAASQAVTWSLSPTTSNVVSINPTTGEIVPLNSGVVVIKATSNVDSTVSASFGLTVKEGETNLTVYHFYDDGYRRRFSPLAWERISSYQDVVSDIYNEIFNLNIETGSIHLYNSIADDCRTSGSLTAPCQHWPTCDLSSNAIRADLIAQFGSGDSTLTKFAWSGHLLDGNPSSYSYSTSHTVVITILHSTDSSHNNHTDDVVRYQSIFSLLHETAHQVGANDHYCYGYDPLVEPSCVNAHCYRCNKLTRPNCAMTRRMSDIETRARNTIFCTDCAGINGTIPTHLKNHH